MQIKTGGYTLSEQSYLEIDRNVRACYNNKSELELYNIVMDIALKNRHKLKWEKSK
jgi:hypothetical protein